MFLFWRENEKNRPGALRSSLSEEEWRTSSEHNQIIYYFFFLAIHFLAFLHLAGVGHPLHGLKGVVFVVFFFA